MRSQGLDQRQDTIDVLTSLAEGEHTVRSAETGSGRNSSTPLVEVTSGHEGRSELSKQGREEWDMRTDLLRMAQHRLKTLEEVTVLTSPLIPRQLATRCQVTGETQARDPCTRPQGRDIRVQRHVKEKVSDDDHQLQARQHRAVKGRGHRQTYLDVQE